MGTKALEEWVWRKAASLEDAQHVTRKLWRPPQEPNSGIPLRMPKCFWVGEGMLKKILQTTQRPAPIIPTEQSSFLNRNSPPQHTLTKTLAKQVQERQANSVALPATCLQWLKLLTNESSETYQR